MLEIELGVNWFYAYCEVFAAGCPAVCVISHFSVTTGEDDGEDLGSMDLDELVHMCK